MTGGKKEQIIRTLILSSLPHLGASSLALCDPMVLTSVGKSLSQLWTGGPCSFPYSSRSYILGPWITSLSLFSLSAHSVHSKWPILNFLY